MVEKGTGAGFSQLSVHLNDFVNQNSHVFEKKISKNELSNFWSTIKKGMLSLTLENSIFMKNYIQQPLILSEKDTDYESKKIEHKKNQLLNSNNFSKIKLQIIELIKNEKLYSSNDNEQETYEGTKEKIINQKLERKRKREEKINFNVLNNNKIMKNVYYF
jgi:hypothetical protein